MRAIILAAGVGNRLERLGGKPKCLLEFGGTTLLHRTLDVLSKLEIDEVSICVGYKSDLVTAFVAHSPFDNARHVVNDAYREGSVVSLWTARETLRCGDDVLLMDADVLYAPAILKRLASSPAANCFLLDRDFEAGEEPVKICLLGGQIVEFRKRLDPALDYDYCGESVGFFKFSPAMGEAVASMTEDYVENDRREAPYEEALRDLVLERPQDFAVEDVTGLPWIEIDFPQDLTRAQEHILPRIDDGTD